MKCKQNKGIHEYTTSTTAGEVCKYCGELRDTKPETNATLSPYFNPIQEEQEIYSNRENALEDFNKHKVSDDTFKRILADTNAKSAIVITFDTEHLDEKQIKMRGFHLNSVLVSVKLVVPLLLFIVDALRGQLGGAKINKVK